VACVQETGWKDASFRFSGGLIKDVLDGWYGEV